MAERSRVLGANIMLRAVLGKRVREMLGCCAADVGLFAPDWAFREVETQWAPPAVKAGMPMTLAASVHERMLVPVQELPQCA